MAKTEIGARLRFRGFFGAQDMTQGKPMRNLLQFSIPLLIGNLAQQLYSTADSIIVGHYVGDNALAAVGASGPVQNLILVLFMAVSTGAGIIVSQYYGAKDRQQLSKSIGNAVVLVLITGLITTLVGLLVARPLMSLLGTPEEIFAMSCLYLEIVFGGMIAIAYYNIISGILRGLGDSVTPLMFLLVACGLNIVLDIIFVGSFGWGVAGAAIATVVSQFVSAVLCLIRLFTMRDVIDLNRKTVRFSRKRTAQLLKLGLPAGITQGIFSMAMVIVQALTNSLGTMVIACSVAVMRVDGFAMLPNFTFGMATSTFVGQNIGAGRLDRVKEGSRAAIKLSMAVAATLTLALLLFGRTLIGWFTDTEAIIDLGMRQLRILAVGYLAMGAMQVYGGIMRGAGDTMPSMWISLITTVLLRVPVAYGWAYFTRSPEWPNGSPDSLYVSLLIAWVAGAVLNYLWYRRGKWKEKSIIQHTKQKKLNLAYVMNRSLPSVTEEDAKVLTHINLAFGLVKDGLLDMSQLTHIAEIERIRGYNPALKFVLSVGGWGAGGFSPMAMTEESRKAFAASCLEAVERYKLDGIDIDWEYPCMDLAEIEADPRDKENFTHLLAALREALGAERIVSIAAGAGTYFCENTEMDKVAEICDYVQLMTYDIRSGFDSEAGHHTNLFTNPNDPLARSSQATVEDFAAHGVPKERMILGVAFYGRHWEGVPDENHGLFQPAKTVGLGGPNYGMISETLASGDTKYVRYWDDAAKAPWLFDGSTFVSYDDPQSLKLKCEYVMQENLMGMMYWEHGSDPTRTLLKTIAENLR